MALVKGIRHSLPVINRRGRDVDRATVSNLEMLESKTRRAVRLAGAIGHLLFRTVGDLQAAVNSKMLDQRIQSTDQNIQR